MGRRQFSPMPSRIMTSTSHTLLMRLLLLLQTFVETLSTASSVRVLTLLRRFIGVDTGKMMGKQIIL